jgi:hypothetical protein
LDRPEDSVQEAGAPAAATSRAAGRTRLWAAIALAACGAVLGIAVWMKPDPRGFGTHQQLGSGPCGMLLLTGLPCPTCGMTTAFAHTVRGQWLRAFWVQPAGFALALATVGAVLVLAWVIVRGRWPQAPLWLSPYRLFLALLVLLVGGWAFKIITGLAGGSLPYR